jgi:hypothetical protein
MSDGRKYTQAEHAAFKAISLRHWRQPYEPGRGPTEYATEPGWPGFLRSKAAEMERLAPLYRLAADAMEREIEIDKQLRDSQ